MPTLPCTLLPLQQCDHPPGRRGASAASPPNQAPAALRYQLQLSSTASFPPSGLGEMGCFIVARRDYVVEGTFFLESTALIASSFVAT